jgi:ABC-type transport system involved in cytochrome c biogenesis ATPase subunit
MKLKGMITAAESKIEEKTATIVPGVQDRVHEITGLISRFKGKLADIKNNAKNVINLHDCPTCKQSVTEAHKSLIEAAAEVEAGKLTDPLLKLDSELLKAQEAVDKNNTIAEEIKKFISVKDQLKSKLTGVEMLIKQIESKMVDANEDVLIQKELDEIDAIGIKIKDRTVDLQNETELEQHHVQLLQILKDDGIKASIVAQYLPFLNQTINSILDQLNLYVQINIDSEFNVSMFAPDRKGQTIENLSTGQCRRIDLAVLIAWREIAKNKASVDCNVLILDEILENLSSSGVEEFMEMWESIGKETNLIVISQRAAEFDQYFDRTIRYSLKNDLTVEV